jgi:hypothetical protein
MYSYDINNDNSCYKHVLNKNVNTLKQEQKNFIVNTLKLINNKIYNISDVVFFGHEPLLTFKQKKKTKMTLIISDLLEILFKEKTKYTNISFHWICADYHVYQNSIIHSKSEPKLNITQWIFGTGGGELDELVEDADLDIELYGLKILPNIVFDSKGVNVSDKFNDTKGLDRFGYGEITFNLCSVTHKFILSDYDYASNKKGGNNNTALVDYKSKYIKYKNKYIGLKKIDF